MCGAIIGSVLGVEPILGGRSIANSSSTSGRRVVSGAGPVGATWVPHGSRGGESRGLKFKPGLRGKLRSAVRARRRRAISRARSRLALRIAFARSFAMRALASSTSWTTTSGRGAYNAVPRRLRSRTSALCEMGKTKNTGGIRRVRVRRWGEGR